VWIADDSTGFATELDSMDNREAPVKQTMTAVAALMCVSMALVGGCSNKKNDPMAMNAGVTDISAVPPTPLAVEAPVAAAPVAQPVVSEAPEPVAAAAPAAPAGGKYKVQKGDTLWKIASTSYGDGKQWQKIASANPGLSPATLKAGQTIMLP
jgi:LysM repeat protein